MAKEVLNKRYMPEFKELVTKIMLEKGLGFRETCRRFEVNDRGRIMETDLSGRKIRRISGGTLKARQHWRTKKLPRKKSPSYTTEPRSIWLPPYYDRTAQP